MNPSVPGVPAEFQPFLTALFLAALVAALTTPFKKSIDPAWMPLIDVVVALLLNVGVAYYVHADVLLAALSGVVTALVAAGLYQHATTAVLASAQNPRLRRQLLALSTPRD